MLFRQRLQRGILQQSALSQRTPRFSTNSLFPMVSRQLFLLKPRMQLDLIDRWYNPGCIDNSLEMRNGEIGYPDRFGSSLFLEFYQRFPGLDVCVLTWLRPMNQIKIHVIELKVFKAFIEPPMGRGVPVVPEFGCNK